MSGEEIRDLADRYAGRSLREYREFLSLPNTSVIPSQLEANLQWLREAFQKRGFAVRRLATGGIDLLFAERRSRDAEQAPTILFYFHADGQPVDPAKWEQESPFRPVLKVRDGEGRWTSLAWESIGGGIDPEWRVFARSASDDKGPINMFLAALDAVQAQGVEPAFHIKVLVDCEEEIGSPHLAAAVASNRERLQADWLVIHDGPVHLSNRPTLVFGARGIAGITLRVFGPRVPLHSGHYGNYAPNPALSMSRLLASMKDEEGRVTIPGFYQGIELDATARGLLEGVPDDSELINRHLGIARPDRVGESLQESLQYPSLNIRGLSSGWVGDEVRTVIPSNAVVEIDVRLVPESSPERLIERIEDHIRRQGFHLIQGEMPTEEERATHPRLISMRSEISYRAFRTDVRHPLGRFLEAAITRAHGEVPIKVRTLGGSVPIAPFISTLKVPAVLVPTVNSDNNQHSPNENLRLGNYFDGVATLIGILTQPPER